jgi:GTPase SAR1 family protein
MKTLNLDLAQTLRLQRCDCVDEVQRRHNAYAEQEGLLTAFSANAEQLDDLFIGQEAKDLQYLYLNDAENLRKVTFVTALPKLEHLYVARCKLKTLRLPAGFSQLQQVFLGQNELEELECLGDYPALKILDLAENPLNSLQLTGQYPVLEGLYLRKCDLKEIHLPDRLPTLRYLKADGNRFRNFPLGKVLKSPLQSLILNGSAPKEIPQALLGDSEDDNALEAAQVWHEETKDPATTEANQHVKLMLLGNGNAGKSSVIEALRLGKSQIRSKADSTQGVDIGVWKKDKLHFNYWDFGGQEIYHGTHRLFLSSAALQLLVFDPESEQAAREHRILADRIDENRQDRNYPLLYWYEITKELSEDSRFFVLQNKIDLHPETDLVALEQSKEWARFQELSATSGQNVELLAYYLEEEAKEMPEHAMLVPKSWIAVRNFFTEVQNGQHPEHKRIYRAKFEELCDEATVSEISRPYLLKYLHHNGFLYTHPDLDDSIIADQRWALSAIYRILERGTPHFDELLDDFKGKVRARKLFEYFGSDYSESQKWLFLDFMKSCGLCFQLNEEDLSSERNPLAYFVFPEFLPAQKPESVNHIWQNRAKDVHVLRMKLPYLNRVKVLNFIAALGRKTPLDNIWRNGINILTPHDGYFMVEQDEQDNALYIHIEEAIMETWLEKILEAFQWGREGLKWEISSKQDPDFEDFNFENWKNDQAKKAENRKKAPKVDLPVLNEQKPLAENLKDVPQKIEVLLLLGANPVIPNHVGSQLSIAEEFNNICEKLSQDGLNYKVNVYPRSKTNPISMNEEIWNLRPTMLHFSGHGSDQGGLCFASEDGRGLQMIEVNIIEELFEEIKKEHPQLKIVLLNACFSKAQAQAISKHGIYAIGVNKEVKSPGARAFAAGFYLEYLNRGNVLGAFKFGRAQALTKSEPKDRFQLFFEGEPVSI